MIRDIKDLLFAVGIEYNEKNENSKDNELDFLERATSLELPYDYRMLFKHFENAKLGPAMFEFHLNDEPMMRVITQMRLFKSILGTENGSIMHHYSRLKGIASDQFSPERIIPIGTTNNNAMLVLDYRDGEKPKVAILDEGFIHLADSITELFEKMIEHNYFRRLLATQNIRKLRAYNALSDVLDTKAVEEALTKINANILSEEAATVLQHSELYSGTNMHVNMEDMMRGTVPYPLLLKELDYNDMKWVTSNEADAGNVWALNRMEKHFGRKLPKSYKKYVAAHNGLHPEGGNKFMYVHEGKFGYFHIDMLVVSEEDSNGPVYETFSKSLDKVRELTNDQDMINIIDRLVPFATVTSDTKLGMACFYYKDDEEEPMVVIHYLETKKINIADSYPWVIYPMAIDFSDFVGGLSFEAKINYLRVKQIVRVLSSADLSDTVRGDLKVALCGLVSLESIEVSEILGSCSTRESMKEFFPDMAKSFDPVQIAIDQLGDE
jgi:hypothetical protein